MPTPEQKSRYPQNSLLKEIDALYWRPPGGESIADVRLRVRNFFDTLHRECEGQTVLLVTHGEFMSVARASLEYLSDEEWLERDDDKSHKIRNTHVYHYSRRDPETGDLGKYMSWRRSICPWQPETYSGWVSIKRRRFSNEELLKHVSEIAPVVAAISSPTNIS